MDDPSLAEERRRLEEKLEERQLRIQKIEAERLEAVEDLEFYKGLVYSPGDDVIYETASYKSLIADFEARVAIVTKLEADLKEATAERDSLRDGQEAFREILHHESSERENILKNTLRDRERDVARLRGQRDTIKESHDLIKAQHASSSHSREEVVRLTELREQRLKVMASEIKRLRGKIASAAGEEDYLSFILQGNGEDATYVRHLEGKLRAAADKETALQAQMVSYAQGSSDKGAMMAAETRARQDAVEARRLLEERVSLIQSGNQAQLLQQLEEKEKARKVLELQLKDAESVSGQRLERLEIVGLAHSNSGLLSVYLLALLHLVPHKSLH